MIGRSLLSKHTTMPQRRYIVAATSRRCSNVVTTLLWRFVFAGYVNSEKQRLAWSGIPLFNDIFYSLR